MRRPRNREWGARGRGRSLERPPGGRQRADARSLEPLPRRGGHDRHIRFPSQHRVRAGDGGRIRRHRPGPHASRWGRPGPLPAAPSGGELHTRSLPHRARRGRRSSRRPRRRRRRLSQEAVRAGRALGAHSGARAPPRCAAATNPRSRRHADRLHRAKIAALGYGRASHRPRVEAPRDAGRPRRPRRRARRDPSSALARGRAGRSGQPRRNPGSRAPEASLRARRIRHPNDPGRGPRIRAVAMSQRSLAARLLSLQLLLVSIAIILIAVSTVWLTDRLLVHEEGKALADAAARAAAGIAGEWNEEKDLARAARSATEESPLLGHEIDVFDQNRHLVFTTSRRLGSADSTRTRQHAVRLPQGGWVIARVSTAPRRRAVAALLAVLTAVSLVVFTLTFAASRILA